MRALAVKERTDDTVRSTVRIDTNIARPAAAKPVESTISVSFPIEGKPKFMTAGKPTILKKPAPDAISARKYSSPK